MTWENTASTPSSGHFTYTIGTITRSDGTASTNIAATSNGATITVTINSTGITNFDEVNAYVPVTITLPNGTTRDARITLFGVATGEAGQAIDLYTSCSVIRTDSDKTVATPSSISIGVKIGRGNNVATYLSGNDAENRGYSFKYAYDNATIDSSTPQHRGAITIDSANHSSITVEMFKNGVMIDAETIPFVADGSTGASVIAQYSPDRNTIHSTWQSGDIYMRTKSTTDSEWSPWYKIVGESGGETNYSFGISAYDTTANVSTAPSDISSWSDAPIATTAQKPYLWAKVQKKDGNGNNIGNPSYIRLTGEKGEPGTAFVADIDNQMVQVPLDADGNIITNPDDQAGNWWYTTHVRAFYGATNITNECTFTESHDDTDLEVTIYNANNADSTHPIGTLSVEALSGDGFVSGDVVTVTVTHPTYAPAGRTVQFTMIPILPGADGNSTTYDLLPSMTQIHATRDANGNYTPQYANITCGYVKNANGTTTTVTDVNSAFDGYEVYFKLHERDSGDWGDYYRYRSFRNVLNFTLVMYDKIEFIICTNTTETVTENQITGLRDRETVPVVSDGVPG